MREVSRAFVKLQRLPVCSALLRGIDPGASLGAAQHVVDIANQGEMGVAHFGGNTAPVNLCDFAKMLAARIKGMPPGVEELKP